MDERFAAKFASLTLIYKPNEIIVQWMVTSVGRILNTSRRKFDTFKYKDGEREDDRDFNLSNPSNVFKIISVVIYNSHNWRQMKFKNNYTQKHLHY